MLTLVTCDDPDKMSREELAVLVRQGFEDELFPDFCRYMYEYCRKHNITHSEAAKHIIVQDVYVQYLKKSTEKKEECKCVSVNKDYSDDRSC